jgi:hypothetical protein
MSLTVDVSDALRGLEAFVELQEAKIRRGLRAAAADAQSAMQQTSAHGDVTGATRAGYRAYVVGGSLVDQAVALQAINSAVAAVEAKNPGHSATSDDTIGADSWGVVLTCPTDYQEKLETENAGEKAVLAPTFAAFQDEFTARAAEGR